MITARALNKETIQLLRIPFSFYLAPVFLFALSQTLVIHWFEAFLSFIILHLLVYPSSNGFNSYMDRDTTSIGGLEKPPLPTHELYVTTMVLDVTAVLLSIWIHPQAAIFVALYIIASRAYSDRRIRLKKHPWTGFFVVSVFQGGVAFLAVYLFVNQIILTDALNIQLLFGMLISSLLIGASYPLTQIYQHKADQSNHDTTLSIRLGYTGTFLFSASLFVTALVLLFIYFNMLNQTWMFHMFTFFTFPIAIFFGWWFLQVRKNHEKANYKNTMRMNTISAACMTVYFFTLIIIKYF